MIIKNNFNKNNFNKNNFNKNNADPLTDYKGIGKGQNSLDNYQDKKNNVDNNVIRDILAKDKEYIEDTEEEQDKWKFFR